MTSYVFVICTCYLCVTSALDLPDLRSVFGSFYDKKASNEQQQTRPNSGRERVKRQDPGIGDESQLHYMIKAARCVLYIYIYIYIYNVYVCI